MSIEDIYNSGKFSGRTYKAILHQIQRLGALLGTQSKISFGTQISEADGPSDVYPTRRKKNLETKVVKGCL